MPPNLIFTVVCLFAADFIFTAFAADSHSLVEAGIPALGREWSGKDYVRAAEVLASGKMPLPRLSDEEGRAFLQRLTSKENLSLQRNKTLPLAVRMDDSFALGDGSKAIMKQYMVTAGKDGSLHAEVALQMCFMLRATEVTLELIGDFLPTIVKDEKYDVRMAGLKQAYLGITQVFVGAESSLSEKKFYSSEDLSLLLGAMAEVLPTFKKAFPSDYPIELRQKLKVDKASFTGKDAELIQKMLDEVSL